MKIPLLFLVSMLAVGTRADNVIDRDPKWRVGKEVTIECFPYFPDAFRSKGTNAYMCSKDAELSKLVEICFGSDGVVYWRRKP